MNKILFKQKQYPVFQQRVYNSVNNAISCLKGDIQIIEDCESGLIYNTLFRPELVVYDQNYNNEQSLSNRFQLHLKEVAELIEYVTGKEKLIEIGCGKGFFLELLQARGFQITGFDSTYDGQNPSVIKKNFESNIISSTAKLLILRHVLEHIQNPYEFLCQIRDANRGGGLIYIEVPCFDWICKKKTWFDIFYEHVNYFRTVDFYRMFGRVVESKKTFGGQYISIVADLATLRKPVYEESQAVDFPCDFLSNLRSIEETILQKTICLWGGGSKGVIYSLFRQRAGLAVDMVIDINPAKQGRYLPATGLKVESPETALKLIPSDTLIYVMNSNYLDEIKERTKNKYNYITIDG
jgi:SAM-dependent methyltransferase